MVNPANRSTGSGNPSNKRASGARSVASGKLDLWLGGSVVLLKVTDSWGFAGLVTMKGGAELVPVCDVAADGNCICTVDVTVGTTK